MITSGVAFKKLARSAETEKRVKGLAAAAACQYLVQSMRRDDGYALNLAAKENGRLRRLWRKSIWLHNARLLALDVAIGGEWVEAGQYYDG